jgi:hypothetical protein
MLLSSHQNAGQNIDIKVTKRSFGNEAEFKCLGNASNKYKFNSRGQTVKFLSGFTTGDLSSNAELHSYFSLVFII